MKKSAEIIFFQEKTVNRKILDVLDESMKSLDPYQNKSSKFLGMEQAAAIKTGVVYGRVSKEMNKRMKTVTDKQIHERNLANAINIRVIPVASYVINACNFTKKTT